MSLGYYQYKDLDIGTRQKLTIHLFKLELVVKGK